MNGGKDMIFITTSCGIVDMFMFSALHYNHTVLIV